MQGLLERTHILLGDEKLARLQNARVFIAGLGGVGSFAAEALARMGVGI
jgi:tRNA A37 threonylcarbamoyladenosine dehydratase